MIEGDALEGEIGAGHGGRLGKSRPGLRVRERRFARGVEIRKPDDVLERRQFGEDLANDRRAIVIFAGEAIAVGHEDQFRFDLPEAVDDRAGAEFGSRR